jgi:penicillin-binding protein 1A
MEMALANTIFPNGGTRPVKPFIINRIEEQTGRILFSAQPESKRVTKPSIAYEVHSCLAGVLESGTGERAYSELGLKHFPLGGKTGTAYNFTDDWFLGYSSEVTCGIWVGFDKPKPIYHGAFSNEVALPIWTKVMSATFANYRPKEIAFPKGLVKCEICEASGELATPKCVETAQNKDTGETITRRTTYFEIADEAAAPKNPCPVHNGGALQTSLKVVPGEQWPRAVAAVNVSEKVPVILKAATVIGDVDPYNSVQAINNVIASKALNGQLSPMESSGIVPAPVASDPGEPEVRRAEAVRPQDQMQVEESTIKLDPPEPIKF